MPGLIPGASEGRGLGLDFLRHLERCAVLAHVVDCATLDPGRDPISDVDALEAELAAYEPPLAAALSHADLADRPRVVILNKTDTPEAAELADLLQLGPIAEHLMADWATQRKGRALWCVGRQIYKVHTVLDPAAAPSAVG